MKNTLLKGNLRTYEDYIFTDYHEIKFNALKNIENLGDFTEFKTIQNNTKLEKISYDLYGSTDYWDILAGINDIDPMISMPYDYDIINDLNSLSVQNYKDNVFFGVLPDSHMKYLTEAFFSSIETENEKFRIIKIITPTKMQDFIKLLREKGYI